jgi:hypothetical protein
VQLPVKPWDPWAALHHDHPHVRLVTTLELPGKLWGLTIPDPDGLTVLLCKRLNPNQRTSTLCHELVHVERGIFHTSTTSPEALAEERIVCDTASRRLIPAAQPRGGRSGRA